MFTRRTAFSPPAWADITLAGAGGNCWLIANRAGTGVILMPVATVTLPHKPVQREQANNTADNPPRAIAPCSSKRQNEYRQQTRQYHQPHHFGVVAGGVIIVSVMVHSVFIN